MTRAVVLAFAVLALVGAAPKEKEKGKPPAANQLSLPEPDYMPPLARQLLRQRMQSHGRDQSRLVIAVTLLERDVVKSIATDVANEPRLVRPTPEARDELNAALPERFFVLQDALRLRAKDLAAAAENKDDAALAKAFGQLVETCVSCHSAYLNP